MAVWLATVALGATAQVYKSVGPDGKVTYSDRPPAEAETRVEVLRAGVAGKTAQAPAVPAAGPQPAAEGHNPGFMIATTLPIPPGPPPGELPAVSAVDQRLAAERQKLAKERYSEGIATVLRKNALAEVMAEFCGQILPAQRNRLDAEHDAWRERHVAIIQKTNTALKQLAPADRAQLEDAARASKDGTLRLMGSGDRERWIARCKEAPATFLGNSLDLSKGEGVGVLMHYDVR